MTTLLREASASLPPADIPHAPTRALPQSGRLPHICFVAPAVWPVLSHDPKLSVVGGAEVQQSFLARGLAHAGCRVSMICLDYGQPRHADIDGIEMHKAHRPEAGLPVLRFLHPRMTSWWQAMRAVDADVYYQRSSAMLTAVVAEFCRLHGKRSIYAAASDVDFRPGQEPIRYARDRWLFHQGLRRVDRIVVQNVGQQQECRQAYGRASALIPSCYEAPPNARRGGDLVLWAGVMRPGKRPLDMIDIARRLPHRRFVLIGGPGGEDPREAEHFSAVQAAAATLPNVRLTGFLPIAEVEPWFDQARVVVNTSDYEGMPNTFLQAWARGIPTHAFLDVGARLHGEPLYRVSSGVEEAAHEIERHFTDETYWRRQSERSLTYFNATHSMDHVIGCYQRLLEELVAEKS